jgi:hypothetical protein
LQKEINKETFRRELYKPHPGMLEQWKTDIMRVFDEMNNYIITHAVEKPTYVEKAFPRRRTNCQTKFGVCQFHHICSVPDTSKFQNSVRQKYTQKEEKWQAWKA